MKELANFLVWPIRTLIAAILFLGSVTLVGILIIGTWLMDHDIFRDDPADSYRNRE